MYKVFLIFQRNFSFIHAPPFSPIILSLPVPSHLQGKPQPSVEVFHVLEHLDLGLISVLKGPGAFFVSTGIKW